MRIQQSKKTCFLIGADKLCTDACMAYSEEGKTRCRLLNGLDKLTSQPNRPTLPIPLKKI